MLSLLKLFRFLVLFSIFCATPASFAQEENQSDLNSKNPLVEPSEPIQDMDLVTRKYSEMDFEYEFPTELQKDLPQAAARAIPERKPKRDPWFDLDFLGPFLKLVFWGLLAAAILFVAYGIINEIIRARKNFAPKLKEEELPDIPIYKPDEEQARVLLDDADRLAAEGKFEEAVHVLLFRSIQDISAKRPHYVKRSLTSREISALPILTDKAKKGFATIGRLVENSFFGGKPLDADDYAMSKSAYKDFAFEKVAR